MMLVGCSIPGVPAEALSQSYGENCLQAVRAHYRDLEAGSATQTDVKMIVLGHGRVGKTQICRRLRDEDYDGDEPSTHGILVTSADLLSGELASPTRATEPRCSRTATEPPPPWQPPSFATVNQISADSGSAP
jgi:hypothetical protein